MPATTERERPIPKVICASNGEEHNGFHGAYTGALESLQRCSCLPAPGLVRMKPSRPLVRAAWAGASDNEAPVQVILNWLAQLPLEGR